MAYHRLSSTVNAWLQQSVAQVKQALEMNSEDTALSDVDEEFYEKKRIDNQYSSNQLDIYKEAQLVNALTPIRPIRNYEVCYGGREPYRDVKAHLISPYSCRISAASRHVDDNRISDRGRTPLVVSNDLDRVSFRIRPDKDWLLFEKYQSPFRVSKSEIHNLVDTQEIADKIDIDKIIKNFYCDLEQLSWVTNEVNKMVEATMFYNIIEEIRSVIDTQINIGDKLFLNKYKFTDDYLSELQTIGSFQVSKQLKEWVDESCGWFLSNLDYMELGEIYQRILYRIMWDRD